MKIQADHGDEAVLEALGARLAAMRVGRNLTQAQLAQEAGVSKRTVERLESGAGGTQLSAFIRICRLLGVQERLELLLPEPAPSPLAQLKLKGRTRKRASGTATGIAEPAPHGERWSWKT
ncbi:MAG TPA: helix-turn-helix transcriptional regulator [Solimonas sp.]